jgi:DNA-binding transcriptional ArsR family regulator
MLAERGEQCVCRIVEELDMGQPAVSHHLAKLKYAHLIKPRRQGQWIHYSLNLEMLENGALTFLRQLVGNARAPKSDSVPCCEPESTKKC